MSRVSFSTSDDRLVRIDRLIVDKIYPDRSTCINNFIDHGLKNLEINKIVDFMQFVAFPLFFFMVSLGISIVTPSIFFYILSGLAGLYLIIFGSLYYRKQEGFKKWQKG